MFRNTFIGKDGSMPYDRKKAIWRCGSERPDSGADRPQEEKSVESSVFVALRTASKVTSAFFPKIATDAEVDWLNEGVLVFFIAKSNDCLLLYEN